MTPFNKPVRRRTDTPHRGRRLIVSLEPGDVIGFREERRRKIYYTTAAACFDLAVKQYAAAQRALKKTARKK